MEKCINHPNDRGIIIIRPWQMEFCEGDKCAAELLSLFEYWHNIKIRTVEQNKEENDRRIQSGLKPIYSESTLQWHSRDQLIDQLFNRYTHKTIKKSIDLLKSKKCLSQESNPNNSFDKTKFFQFHPEIINEWLIHRSQKKCSENLHNQEGKTTSSIGENYPIGRVNLPNLLNTQNTYLRIQDNKYNVGLCKNETNEKKNKIPYEEIIDYLNKKTNQNYRYTTPKTKELIFSRWKEGFTKKDFYQVIDNMCNKWINDSKMKPYLRPHTLFSTKFESYLNQSDDKLDMALRNNEIGKGTYSVLKMGDLE
ncbi:conserved phage C-terminal domain-containing protein [Flavobacterium sp.]|uniref:conserved phage C-terminal domain-containing protein n=1 Tax=Flavobacterium sp. TaxID=239 RepID=UPI003F69F3E4